jgi:hypothetical protein
LRLLYTCLKWCNTYRSNPTSTPLHHTFYVMISVTFPVWRKSKLAFPSAGDWNGEWVYNNQYQNEYQIQMVNYLIGYDSNFSHFIPIDIRVFWLVSWVNE